jgi:hypothetical protein
MEVLIKASHLVAMLLTIGANGSAQPPAAIANTPCDELMNS